MPLDLAGLLVEAGAVSAGDLERALERQRALGGSLDTALLELGLAGEAELGRFLSSASGLPPPPPDAAPDDRARRVFPARVAERYGLAPLRLEGRELTVAATFPVDLAAMDEIGFMLSLQLVPLVATEWRVRELLAQVYGGEVPERYRKLAAAARAPAGAPAAAEDFEVVAEEAPPERSPEPPSVAPFLGLAAEPVPAGAPAPPVPPPAGGHPGWTRGDALAALDAARDRDAAVEVALRFASQVSSAAAMFGVARDRIAGHDAAGWEGARERCRAVRVSAGEVPMFGAALSAGLYFGPLPPGNEALLASLGRASPRTALVLPIAVRERIACILYADGGDEPVAPDAIADLLVVGNAVGAALERILRAGKRGQAEAAMPPAPPEPPVPAAPRPRAPEEAVVDGALARFLGEGGQPFGPAADPPAPAPAPPPPSAEAGWGVLEPAQADVPREPASREVEAFEVAPAADALAVPLDPRVAETLAALRGSARGSPERERAIAAAVRHGPEAAAALRAAFPGPLDAGCEGAAAADRGPVLAAMRALGPVATPFLADLLLAPDADRRRCAAELLGELRDPASFVPLAEVALDLEPAVSAAAVEALAGVGRHPDFHPVLERLRRELLGGPPARAARAAHALARLGDCDAVPLLVQALELAAPADRAARGALERLTCRRFGDDGSAWIAWWRAHRRERRIDWLFGALEDPDREVRAAAAEALAASGAPPGSFPVDGDSAERARAARAWRSAWEEREVAL